MTKQTLSISVTIEHFPLKNVFRISRGAKTQADVIVVKISDGDNEGWAEAVPYVRYGESIESVIKQVQDLAASVSSVSMFEKAMAELTSGSAKNALDCAFWDLKAKQQQISVAAQLELPNASPCVTAQTISIDTPEAMAKAVSDLGEAPMIKVKLDNNNIIEKMQAISQAAPNSKFIVDANEAWSIEDLQQVGEQLVKLNVALIEQPLPAGQDHQLIDLQCPVPLCADESCHTREDLAYLKGRYQVVNIKLDKTGGLTEAYELAKMAQQQGFDIMLGCMVGSSLAMAPASLLTPFAKYVDLDGPLLISQDREHGFAITDGIFPPLNPMLWGS